MYHQAEKQTPSPEADMVSSATPTRHEKKRTDGIYRGVSGVTFLGAGPFLFRTCLERQ